LSKKILVVEDDETTADYVVGGLEQNGFVVDRASNGRDGLFHATDGKYAAIVLDDKSGQVLHEDHADDPRHPASLTKITGAVKTAGTRRTFDYAIDRVTEALEERGGKGTSFRLGSQAIMVEARAG